MTDDDTARLRALAQAAPKGPWTLLGAPDDAAPHLWTIVTADGLWTAREPVAEFHKLLPHGRALQAAAGRYIAAVSPDVLLRLLDALDEARRERDAARENGREWHRRAQYAEAACAAAREDKPRSSKGRSLGRALANASAEHYRTERDAAMALLRECDEVATSLCGVADLVEHGDLFARIDAMLSNDKGA